MPDLNVDRRDVLQALADVNDRTWCCLLRALQGMNMVLADVAFEDPSPNMRLDAAIDAELARLTQT